MYNAQPEPNRVDEGTPAYHSGPQSMVGNYYVDADATNEPAGTWTRPDLTDEQMAELNPRTRTSIEHSREVEANKGGRPPIGPRIHVALYDETLQKVDRFAQRTGRTRAEAIRWLVVVGLSDPNVKSLAE